MTREEILSPESPENNKLPGQEILKKVLEGQRRIVNWLIEPTELPSQLDDPYYYDLDLPLLVPNFESRFGDASRLLTISEDEYHKDIHNIAKELRYREAKKYYEATLLARDTNDHLWDTKEKYLEKEQEFENGQVIEWELKKINLAIKHDESVLDTSPKNLKDYFGYLRNRNKKSFTLEPYADLKYRKIIYIALVANISNVISRHTFGYFPFPHYDKIADVAAYMHEPQAHGMLFKNVINLATKVLNDKLLTEKGRELFIYKSFTREDNLLSMAFYGGLWITSEITNSPLHPLHSIAQTTADSLDVPAHALGLLAQWKISKEIIKRFPPGRFKDMETAVSVRISNLEKQGKINPKSIKDIDNPDQITQEMVSTYKVILRAIKSELLDKSRDVKDYSMHNPESKDAYDLLIRNYTFALSRRWLIDKLYQTDILVRSTFLDKQIDKLDKYVYSAQDAAKIYRRTIT